MDIQQTIASPRLMMNRSAGRVPVLGTDVRTYTDPGYPAAVLAKLKALGHTLSEPGNAGAVQGVYVDPETGAIAGGSDPRRDGHAIAW